MYRESIEELLNDFIPPQSIEEQWDIGGLQNKLREDFDIHLPVDQWLHEDESLHEESLRERVLDAAVEHYQNKLAELGDENMRHVQKQMMLQLLDQYWREHLSNMDHMRQGIHLRGYAQKNPTQEFKRESFDLFTGMWSRIKYDLVSMISRVRLANEEEMQAQQPQLSNVSYQHTDVSELPMAEQEEAEGKPETFVREGQKVGRNDPCPCGSGKKYKQCHGKLQ